MNVDQVLFALCNLKRVSQSMRVQSVAMATKDMCELVDKGFE